MPKTVAELRLYLSRVKPWAAVATLCALVLAGYYSTQGMRYWQTWEESRAMTSEIQQITRKLDNGAPLLQQMAGDLETQQQELEELMACLIIPM